MSTEKIGEIPIKKRKVYIGEDNFLLPTTEHRMRKKCAKTQDGLAIKYNKLMFNFEKILDFNHFRKYCVFFDVFSRRHLINHKFRIDLLEIFNRYDFSEYTYSECYCKRSNMFVNFPGSLVCFKSLFMERRKYCNYKDNKSEIMTKLYEKHSILSKDNYFYDNRINECFLGKIKRYEELLSLALLNRKKIKIIFNNMYMSHPNVVNCENCNNLVSLDKQRWRIVHFLNSIDMNNTCDYVFKIDNTFYIPNYIENDATKIIVYKNTKSNIVLLYNNIFYVINSKNTILIFDIDDFKNVNFFCNFNFYFVKESNTFNNNNFINLN